MFRGFGPSHKSMCPYCGGMHPANQCPMMMYPPAMPMPSMPPMPMPPYPTMPPMDGMAGMHEHMMKVEQALQQISNCCAEVNQMVKEIYLKMAKG